MRENFWCEKPQKSQGSEVIYIFYNKAYFPCEVFKNRI